MNKPTIIYTRIVAAIIISLALFSPLYNANAQPRPDVVRPASGYALTVMGQIGGAVNSVAITGDYAYLGVGPRLFVFSISTPGQITATLIGKSSILAGVVQDIIIDGNFAYVTAGHAGLRILDISNRTDPVEIGSFVPPSYFQGAPGWMNSSRAVIQENTAYLIDGPEFWVLDITSKTAPQKIGYWRSDTVNLLSGISVSGNYAYLVDLYGSRLRVLDITLKESPHEVSSIATPRSYPQNVNISGSYAYIVDMSCGFTVVDISNPLLPKQVGDVTVGSTCNNTVTLHGNYAYLTAWRNGIAVIDITNPASPQKAANIKVGGYTNDLEFYGDYIFAACDLIGLCMIDVANPQSSGVKQLPAASDAFGVVTKAPYAYVSNNYNGLRIIDITNPAELQETGAFTPIDQFHNYVSLACCSTLHGNLDYQVDINALWAIDVSDPAHPRGAGKYTYQGGLLNPQDITNDGQFVYVADASLGLLIFDIHTSITPTLVSTLAITGQKFGIAVAGNLAYVAADTGGLRIVDISDHANPKEIGHTTQAMTAMKVKIIGNTAYVADLNRGLVIINVANPAEPAEVGVYSSSAFGVAVEGNLAYLASLSRGIEILDISNPVSPRLVTSYLTPGEAQGVEVLGDNLIVNDKSGGVITLHLSTPLKVYLPAIINGQ